MYIALPATGCTREAFWAALLSYRIHNAGRYRAVRGSIHAQFVLPTKDSR